MIEKILDFLQLIFSFFFKEKKDENIYAEICSPLRIDPLLLEAFIKVESGKTNILNDRVVIRWEAHIFKRYTKLTIKVNGERGKITQECQDNEYLAFKEGCLVEQGKWKKEAYMSTSWGVGQIMGFHYKRLGFQTPEDMVNYIKQSENNSLRLIGKFIATDKKLLSACQEKDYHLIATYYNGKYCKNYASKGQQYDDKMYVGEFMVESDEITFLPSSNWISVKEISTYLFKKIYGANTILIHAKNQDINYKLISGRTNTFTHSPIVLNEGEIDEYGNHEKLVIQDVYIQAESGGVVYIRITSPERD